MLKVSQIRNWEMRKKMWDQNCFGTNGPTHFNMDLINREKKERNRVTVGETPNPFPGGAKRKKQGAGVS